MKFSFSLLIAGLMCLALSGCPIGPHSRLYKPISDWEERAFEKADRNIFPNDVRLDFSSHDSSRIAWPGIILRANQIKTDSTFEVQYLVEHHYFNWIEDFSIQQEHIFLSPKGEGLFQTSWTFKVDSDTMKISESIGDMIIVYGIPTAVNDSSVDVRAYYIRGIDKLWFATDVMDYGRPGEPVKILRVP